MGFVYEVLAKREQPESLSGGSPTNYNPEFVQFFTISSLPPSPPPVLHPPLIGGMSATSSPSLTSFSPKTNSPLTLNTIPPASTRLLKSGYRVRSAVRRCVVVRGGGRVRVREGTFVMVREEEKKRREDSEDDRDEERAKEAEDKLKAAMSKLEEAEIRAEIKRAEAEAPPTLNTLFEDVYAEVPWHLREQQAALTATLSKRNVG